MGNTETFYNKTKGVTIQTACDACGPFTYHVVVASVDLEHGLFSIKTYEHFQLIQCQGCHNFSFRKATRAPGYGQVSNEAKTPRLKTREELYPPRAPRRKKLAEAFLLPDAVAGIYQETYQALCSDQPVLAGVGVRALVEAVCQERSAAGKTLEQKIDGLVTLDLLTKTNAEFLHGLRVLGNEAAHTAKPHSEGTLGAAMDVVEHLLKTVYLLPRTATKLPKRP